MAALAQPPPPDAAALAAEWEFEVLLLSKDGVGRGCSGSAAVPAAGCLFCSHVSLACAAPIPRHSSPRGAGSLLARACVAAAGGGGAAVAVASAAVT